MVLSLDRWVGKVAVVTGASSGIGATIVEHLVQNGLIVVGIARRVERIQEQAKVLSSRKGKLFAFEGDVRKEDDIVRCFHWIEETLGGVSVLVNNAGVAAEGNLLEGDPEDWRKTFEVNVLGVCVATKEAVASMKKYDLKGHIFNINSVAGHVVPNFPGFNVYPASKYAVTALTETLRQDLIRDGLQIKITSISPGLVVSEMTTLNQNYSEDRLKLLKSAPILQTEDIADALLYALSTPEHVQVHELTIKPVGEAV